MVISELDGLSYVYIEYAVLHEAKVLIVAIHNYNERNLLKNKMLSPSIKYVRKKLVEMSIEEWNDCYVKNGFNKLYYYRGLILPYSIWNDILIRCASPNNSTELMNLIDISKNFSTDTVSHNAVMNFHENLKAK